VVRWAGRDVQVAVGEYDVFFPVSTLREPSRSLLGRDPMVVAGRTLLVEEESLLVSEIVTSFSE
jgi:hypothetical protein